MVVIILTYIHPAHIHILFILYSRCTTTFVHVCAMAPMGSAFSLNHRADHGTANPLGTQILDSSISSYAENVSRTWKRKARHKQRWTSCFIVYLHMRVTCTSAIAISTRLGRIIPVFPPIILSSDSPKTTHYSHNQVPIILELFSIRAAKDAQQ